MATPPAISRDEIFGKIRELKNALDAEKLARAQAEKSRDALALQLLHDNHNKGDEQHGAAALTSRLETLTVERDELARDLESHQAASRAQLATALRERAAEVNALRNQLAERDALLATPNDQHKAALEDAEARRSALEAEVASLRAAAAASEAALDKQKRDAERLLSRIERDEGLRGREAGAAALKAKALESELAEAKTELLVWQRKAQAENARAANAHAEASSLALVDAAQLRHDCEALAAKLATAEAQLAQESSRANAARDDADRLRHESGTLKDHARLVARQLAELRSEAALLKEQLERGASGSQGRDDALKRELVDAAAQLAASEQRAAVLYDEASRASLELATLKERVDEERAARVENAGALIRARDHEIENLRQQLALAREQLAMAAKDDVDVRRTAVAETASLAQRLKDKEADLAAALERESRAKAQCAAEIEENVALTERLNAVEKEADRVSATLALAEERLASSSAADEQLRAAHAANAALQAALEAQKRNAERTTQELVVAREQLAGLSFAGAELTASRAEMAALATRLKAMESEAERATEALTLSRTSSEGAQNAANAEIADLAARLQALNTVHAASSGETTEALAAARSEVAELTRQLEAADRELDAATRQVVELQRDVARSSHAQTRVAELEAEVARLRGQVAGLETELASRTTEPKSAPSDDVARLKQQLDGVSADLLVAVKARDAAAGRAADETQARKKADGRLAEAKDALVLREGELQEAREELAALDAHLKLLLHGESTPWLAVPETDDPAPMHLSMDSPVIQEVLRAWTDQRANVEFFNRWCATILSGQPLGLSFQRGVEMDKVSTAVRDALMTLVVPMLRARRDVSLSVHERQRCDVIWHDLRLKVTPKGGDAV